MLKRREILHQCRMKWSWLNLPESLVRHCHVAFVGEPLAAVQLMVEGFSTAPSLASLCQMATESVRRVAQYDRVMIYRFMPDESGWVIAESRAPELVPFLDLHYPAADIPQQARVRTH